MTQLKDSAIPQGSTVLVTGVNGFLGSHIADQFLQRGFKVRGTVRDASRNAWLETLFAKEYDATRFELWQIPDMSISGSLDGAAKGRYTVIWLPLLTFHIMTKIISNIMQVSLPSCIPRPS